MFMNILIIGGYGAFGSFYAKLLKKNKFNVFIKGNDSNYEKIFCEKNGFDHFDDDYSKIDAVIVSVPNKIAPEVVRDISKKLKKGTFICDFCSVKSNVIKELEKLKGKGLEIASIHPMHGPRISSIARYPVITIEIETREKYTKLIDFFRKEDVHLVKSDYIEHDKILAIVQGLTHYSQIVSAETIKETEISLRRLKEFSSPNFDLFVSLISRVLLQNPSLYAQIQTENPFNKEIRDIFSKKVNSLNEVINNKDCEKIEKEIIHSSKIFDSIDNILHNSDLAVSALKFIENTLKENIGKKFLVENISTHHFHYGVILEVNSKEIKMNEGKVTTTIGLNKIRLTTKREMLEWKKNNILEKNLDYSFFIPKTTSKEFIIKIFNNLRIAKFECIDEFEHESFPDNKKSITLRANFFIDDDKEEINNITNKTIKELGFKNR